jgi:hypothetical protein
MAGLLSFLSDITVKEPEARGPLAPLLANADSLKILKYPSDLGSADKGHYISIGIRVQRNTQFTNEILGEKPVTGDASLSSILKTVSTVTGVVAGIVNLVLPESQGSLATTFAAQTKNVANGVRATSQIESVICLYMPDTLNFDNDQGYSKLSASGLATGIAAGGQSFVDTIFGKPGTDASKQGLGNMTPFGLSAALSKYNAGDFGNILFSAATGLVKNPLLEILYSSPDFRKFRFDFMFYPRSEKEAKEVQQIISELRFHQAPEGFAATNGFFLVPPSEFDISFYYSGIVNPNIPKIGVCVLESINVNYAPNGFSAYEIPGKNPELGGTGMPVAIQLSLQFRETEIKTKSSYNAEDASIGLPFRKTREVNSDQVIPQQSTSDPVPGRPRGGQ